MRRLFQFVRRFPKTASVSAFFLAGLILFGTIRMARSDPKLPLAEVQKKEFVDYVELRGEVKALHFVTITAPSGAGDLQILKIVPNGSKVKKGDVLVEFDATTAQQKYAQDLSSLKSADAEIKQSTAAARLKEEQDITDVTKARFDSESAKMDAGKQEILSAIDGAEARLTEANARRKLQEAEEKLAADRAAAAGDLASKKKKREEASYQVQLDERTIHSLVLHAPQNGLIVLQNNWRASGPMQPSTAFKAGDRAWPGAALAELPDPSSLRVSGRIEEALRGRIRKGQSAVIRVDAVPDGSFNGTVDDISTTASMDFNAGWPFPRDFEMGISFSQADARLTPGMGAVVRIAVDRVPDGIVIPSAAVFRKEGRNVVYLRRGSRFEETPVEVARRSGDEVLIDKGLQAGQQVALKDPAAQR